MEEVPADLLDAIAHADMVCRWQEQLTEEDMPPQWMWPLDHELERHFDAVKARHKTPDSGGGGGSDDDDEDDLPENALLPSSVRSRTRSNR